jgi:ribosomal-protein-alanine N-acetyltransferase
MSSYKIRQFRPSDLQDVTKINRACLPENYPDSFFLLIYSSFPQGFLVVEDENGKLIAYTMNRIETGLSNFSRLRRAKKGHVISIAVLPQMRRTGIGLQLMNKALEEMVNQGASECFLEVRTSNIPAVSMYENQGFEKIKELRKYYSDNESAFLMSIKL